MPSRKRSRREAESATAEPEQPNENSLIHKLRNSFYFANLYQWICIFGKVVKLDDNMDIADLETECLKHGSMALQDIGLTLLKHISSHRGLTHALFDEYTRRQFSAKLPHKKNPFGNEEVAARFADFDLIKKLRVLWLMTQIVMMKPEHIRPNMDEQKNDEQTAWRVEPYGWDRKDREYYVLDDNRLYCLTNPPPPAAPAAPPKKTSQKAKAAARAAKRRRVAANTAADSTNDEEHASGAEDQGEAATQDDNEDPLFGATWECVAITLDEVRRFIDSISKTKDPNEKILRKQIEEHMLPLLEKQEESRKRKMLQREKELLALEKMATAKRSSRLAGRAEQQKHEEMEREERQKRQAEEAAARKEEQRRLKIEKERDSRLMSREKRLLERETRRIQHEEELAQLSEGSKSTEAGRLSERRLKAEIEKNKQALQELEEEETEWTFDCICGLHGQVDDGEHSVACERCNVWQHSKCLGINEVEAEREDFHFICKHCQQAERDKKKVQRPAAKIKIKLKEPASTSSTPSTKPVSNTPIPLPQYPKMASNPFTNTKPKLASQPGPSQLNGVLLPSTSASSSARPEPSPQKHSSPPMASSSSNAIRLSSGPALPHPLPVNLPQSSSTNGASRNPFSSPHPNLLPPDLSPNKSRAYGSIYNSSSPAAHDRPDTAQIASSGRPLLSGTPSALPADLPSPTKETATKNGHSVISTQMPANTPVSASKVLDPPGSSPPVATPRLNPTRPEDSETLPSVRGGLSPTKHSPVPHSGSSIRNAGDGPNGVHSSPAPAIMPPIASLSPTPLKMDPTPPVKVDEPARPLSQHSTLFQSSPVQPKPK